MPDLDLVDFFFPVSPGWAESTAHRPWALTKTRAIKTDIV